MIRSLLVSLLFVLTSNVSVAQTASEPTSTVSTTPNVIDINNFTGQQNTVSYGWVNIRDVVGCCTGGPGAAVDTAGDLIWFSWGPSTVSQSIAINQVLSGTGLRVNGFNYSYYWFNYGYNAGNLSSSISLSDNAGKTLESYFWSHPANVVDGWQLNAGTKTFTNLYSIQSLGNITMSFSGQDDKYWAGYYGPAIAMPRLSLNYDTDPCVINPLSSSSCPGFAAAMNKLNPQPTNETTQIASTGSTGSETITESPITTSTVTVASIPATTTNTVEAAPVVTAPASTSNDSSRPRTSNVNAVEIARSVNNMVAAQTQSVVSQSIQQSMSVEISSDQATSMGSESSVLGSGLIVNTSSTAMSTGSSSQTYSSNTMIDVANTVPSVSLPNLTGSSMFGNGMPGLEGPINTNNSTTLSSSNMDSSNPTSTLSIANMSNRPTINTDSEQNSNKESTTSKSEPIAEFTTGIDARQLQVVPIGFNTYLTAQIRDTAFYAPKDIYKGQNNVDNVRALRQLASDRLHEEMVNQQYKR